MRQPERAVELAKEIHDVENAGDIITHETIARLHKTWITPIDRADIHSLITALDDVRWGVAGRIVWVSRAPRSSARSPTCWQ